ncbi:MAG: 4Fe-4S binding protein [Oscillospiraceae bacterium]|nr:4Fe-4S binding protein [Oscillospiraceae bacterium]
MTYIIDNKCIMCGACEEQCPSGAISIGKDQYTIDKNLCISCGACAAVCPVDAPKDEDE